MTNEEEPEEYFALTPEGVAVAETAVNLFGKGHTVEDIAAHLDLPVDALRILVAMYGAHE